MYQEGDDEVLTWDPTGGRRRELRNYARNTHSMSGESYSNEHEGGASSSSNEQQRREPETLSVPKQICNIATSIVTSPEVPMFIYFFAIGIFSAAQDRLIEERICLYKFRSLPICSQVATNPLLAPQRAEIADAFKRFHQIAQFCNNIPLIVIAVMQGSWCDRWLHRASMIMPHAGDAILGLLYLIFSRAPITAMNPVGMGFLSLLSGLTGSWACIVMSTTSYACLKTPLPGRMVRIALVEGAMTAGQLAAYFMNALYFKNNNFPIAFIVQIAVHIYAIVHILALIKEIHTKDYVRHNLQTMTNGSWCRFIWVPKENFPTIWRLFTKPTEKRPGEAPKYLRVMLVTYFFTSMLLGFKALAPVVESFLTLPPNEMSPQQFAIFMAVCSVTMTLALVIGTRLFRLTCCGTVFPIPDAGMALLGLLLRMAALLALGLSDLLPGIAPWFYCVLSMFSLYPIVALRSGMSKLADDNKQGRLFAVLGQMENFSQLGAAYGYQALFALTMSAHGITDLKFVEFFHGYVFFFVAGCTLLPMILILWLGRQRITNWSFKQFAPQTYSYLEEGGPVN